MSRWLRFLSVHSALCSLLIALPVNAVEPLKLYGTESVYRVERKGDPIGEYRLRFRPKPDGSFAVEASMQLELKVLGLFRYAFSYRAEELWQEANRLKAMTVFIDDDGDTREWRVERREDGLYRLEGDKQALRLGDQLLTTNHWHPGMPHQTSVLNTLTGDVSRLDVQSLGEEMIQVGERKLTALGYRLGGDLEDTLTWYDSTGRWLGMEFTARDGSRIRVQLQAANELAERGAL
ncbi:DUF6134 family protein [Marinobacterium sediminicola]|uniref:DUF3108 domain-containing protein n=1 Tax=Marinobacterium sediminicola TaxID=518898 RepID=A0ABY1S436_9GAMM|nr:DUF6134 family protein [Marinobacterium sediminicola]ULG68250.1 DUF6134 family protein [Marinobacterium sediminicola]SMR77780.1 hypothetical protein SAMN04487964_11733 [Marinobacterium sediminicola]